MAAAAHPLLWPRNNDAACISKPTRDAPGRRTHAQRNKLIAAACYSRYFLIISRHIVRLLTLYVYIVFIITSHDGRVVKI